MHKKIGELVLKVFPRCYKKATIISFDFH